MRTLTHGLTEGALFAGIMGFGEGFRRAGFRNLWAVEKEPFCRAVIRTRFPETELFEDVRDCGKSNLRAVDVLTAGFPCQDVSVAGKRAGLAGKRTGLFYQFVRIADEGIAAWVVAENVPGLLSSSLGRDFACVLGELSGFFPQVPQEGWRSAGICVGPKGGVAWRVLDSQYFGIAQRRRRVFIIRGPRIECAATVLFESESGSGDFAEGGEEAEGVAREVAGCLGSIGSGGFSANCEKAADGYLQIVPSLTSNGDQHKGFRNGEGLHVASVLSRSSGHHGHSSPRGDGSDNIIVQQAISSKWAKGSSGPAGDEHHNLIAIQDARGHRDKKQHGIGIDDSGGPMYTLDGTSKHAVAASNTGHSSWRGEDRDTCIAECSPSDSHGMRNFAGLPEGLDSARYRALGNAVTVSVAQWIAERIKAVIEQETGERAQSEEP